MTVLSSEAERLRAYAEALGQEQQRALQRAQAHERGDEGEAVVRRLLDPLGDQGWVVLHRRRWPGTRRADLDHVLVGPQGVVVLDSKNWRGRVRLVGGRLLQGQDDVTGELDDVARQVRAVEDVLVEHGLAPLQVTGAMVLVGHDLPLAQAGRVHVLDDTRLLSWLRARPAVLDPDAVRALAAAVELAVPAYPPPTAAPVPVARPRPQARAPQPALFGIAELDLAELERACRLGVEDWMVYLHPAQLDVVRRRYGGPSRVRGPAGCGKTVVALHRAAYLAHQEPGDLLFLTYVRTLPRVLAALYRRLSPQTADRVAFTGVHAMALRILRDAGIDPRLDGARATTAFNLAWVQVGRAALETPTLGRDYWQEEVEHVLKGRDLQTYEEYAALARTGRRTPLGAEQRQHVWDLYVRYQELLEERGIRDFPDLLALALQAVEQGAAPPYRFVVVDEAQDLSLLAVRLAAALPIEPADGLTLVGDGQQSVYPGGFTLREAGLSVAGRSTVLTTNYRNTRQILDAARAVVAADDFDDLEELGSRGDRPVEAVRDGAAVLDVVVADERSAEQALLVRLQHDLALGLPASGAAVLCRTRREAAQLHRLLRGRGIDTLDLQDYQGQRTDQVKVGTVKRAKGLEFPRVYLPRLDRYVVDDAQAEPERVQRERRELFVAMTRAREGLWRCRLAPAG